MSTLESGTPSDRNRGGGSSKSKEIAAANPSGRTVNDVDFSLLEETKELDRKLTARFLRLKELSAGSITATRLKNAGFETGRPKANIADSLKGDMSNIFSSPTLDALQALGWNACSNRLATAEELAKISAKIEALGFPAEQLAKLFWDISRYCVSTSSSPYSDPKGVIEFDGGAITRDAALAVIRDISTLRRVCRSYAPVVWNYMLVTGQPPEDWQAKGFDKTTRFAAFDFFDCVMNPAAIQPVEGLLREPTREEIIANETHKRIALDRNSSNNRFANNATEITGGKYGCGVQRKYRESNCN